MSVTKIKTDPVVIVAVSVLLVILFNGCTMIGIGVGDILDNKFAKTDSLSTEIEFSAIPLKTEIIVFMNTGDIVDGKLLQYWEKSGIKIECVEKDALLVRSSRFERIPFDAIEYIKIVSKPIGGKVAFGGTGLAADILLYVVLRSLAGIGTLQ